VTPHVSSTSQQRTVDCIVSTSGGERFFETSSSDVSYLAQTCHRVPVILYSAAGAESSTTAYS